MNAFNLRVYAIIINDKNEVLLLDERRRGNSFTKFPGGGLEFGEGLKECLQRELMEELFLDFEIGELFYVNDFFQESTFNKEQQLVSFYFFASTKEDLNLESFIKFDENNFELPRWVHIGDLTKEMMTFPVDRVVVGRLKAVT